MSDPPPSEPSPPLKPSPSQRPLTAQRAHLVCYALLGGLLLYVLIARYARPLLLSDPIGVKPGDPTNVAADPNRPPPAGQGGLADPSQIQHRIDPNLAEWAELTQLPGIGEVTAKRIVAYRQERRQAIGNPNAVVFSRLDDLQPIRGIGDKTLARIAPHLLLPTPTTTRPHPPSTRP